MDSYLAGILTALLPAAGIATWYLVRRYNEKHPLNEAIERAQKTADLKKTLDEYNYSLADLKDFQEGLLGRSDIAKQISESFADEAKRVGELIMSTALTQSDMNQAAFRAHEITSMKLEHVIYELKKYFTPAECDSFDAVQEKWRQYQKSSADFAASLYEGGSIMPLIHASTMEAIAISRLVDLESDLTFRKDVLVPYNER